mgnify:FL=1
MIVEHVSLVDFRNYASVDVALVPGTNLFVGRNGQGKTNLVEAIAYISTLGSHRVSGDQPMIRQGADAAIVRTRLSFGGRQVTVEMQLNRQGANRAQINGAVTKTRELPRYLQTVVFAPEDLGIVRGDPSARRRFIDGLLVQRAPRMAGVIADYERVLRQRTTLLKSARARGVRADSLGTLDIWDDKLVILGTQIIDARAALTADLAAPVAAAYAAIAAEDHEPRLEWALSVRGNAVDDDNEGAASTGSGSSTSRATASGDARRDEERMDTAALFRLALADRRTAEFERGITLVGPHRDDLVLRVRGLPVKGYASHGESWSFALALRLGSAELLRAESNAGDPVLILDDVFAELDAGRRGRLAKLVADYDQVIVTAAVFGDVPESLRGQAVHIERGAIIPAPVAETAGGSAK